MKKVLISMLFVLLTLCLFVSCCDEPKIQSVIFSNGAMDITFKSDGSGFYGGESFSFDFTDSLYCTEVNDNTHKHYFYLDWQYTVIIDSFDTLLNTTTTTIYEKNSLTGIFTKKP